MTTQPLITIVTITFNAEESIAPTMKALASQTWQGFEHLIIDGASTDNTLLIARRLGVPSLRILSEPDKGLYDAMNKGLKMARGKYVLFLNSGDTLHSVDTLKKYAIAAQKNPDIIYADTVIVDSERNVLGPRHLSVPSVLTYQSFAKGMLVCHQAFMVRKSIAPLFDTSYRFSADYEWAIRCIQRTKPGKCVNLRTVAIEYLSDGLTDKNKMKSLRERFRIMTEYYGLLPTVANHIIFVGRAIKRKLKV